VKVLLLALLTLSSSLTYAEETYPRLFETKNEKFCMVVDDQGELIACALKDQCQEYPQCLEALKKLQK